MIYLAVNMIIEGNFDSLNMNQSFKKRKEKDRSEKENDESQKLFSFRRFK